MMPQVLVAHKEMLVQQLLLPEVKEEGLYSALVAEAAAAVEWAA
jgi:hypothetical protein